MNFIWIIFELTNNKEYIFGCFSSEILAMKASQDFDRVEDYRIEKYRLDP